MARGIIKSFALRKSDDVNSLIRVSEKSQISAKRLTDVMPVIIATQLIRDRALAKFSGPLPEAKSNTVGTES